MDPDHTGLDENNLCMEKGKFIDVCDFHYYNECTNIGIKPLPKFCGSSDKFDLLTKSCKKFDTCRE